MGLELFILCILPLLLLFLFCGKVLFYSGFMQVPFYVCSKTLLKLTMPRIKLLRNRREIQIKQMRRDIAKLLETGQEATARIRVIPLFPIMADSLI